MGASDFDGRTSSISGTSVCKQHFLSFAILLYQMIVYEYVPLYLRFFDSIFIGLSKCNRLKTRFDVYHFLATKFSGWRLEFFG